MATNRFRIPIIRGQPIFRESLLDRIDNAIDEGVIVSVVASAGYGKSTLLAQWANRRAAVQPIAWISVDRLDSAPIQRTRALLESINALYPNDDPCDVDRICQSIASPNAGVDVAIDEIEALMAGRDGPPLVWIWDDIHVIQQTAVWAWLDHFLTRLSEHVRIIMLGRNRPRLAHAGRLARGEMIEITEQDLRFSREETALLIGQTPGEINETSVKTVFQRTRGWVTGIKLLAASGPGRPGPVDRPELFDFFAEEVLSELPIPLQQFMSAISVLDVISPASAAHVAGVDETAAAGLIDGLIQRNLFVTVLDSSRREIRLHDLLRDCLQTRLIKADRNGLIELHRLAASFETDPVRGSRHWLEAGDLMRAIELLAQCPERLIKSGRIRLIDDALARVVPGSPLAASGPVLFLQAWSRFTILDLPRSAELFELAANAFRALNASDQMASAAIMAARTYSYAVDIDAARRLLSGVNRDDLTPATRAEYDLECAWQLTAIGQAQAAGEQLAQAIELIEHARSDDSLIRCVDRLRTHFFGIPGSATTFERMHRLIEAAGDSIDDVSRTHGRVIGAWAALARGDVERAESLLSAALDSLSAWVPIRTTFVDVSICGALLAQIKGDFARAKSLIEGLLVRTPVTDGHVSAGWDVTYLWLLGRLDWQAGDHRAMMQTYARLLTGSKGSRWPFLDLAITHFEGLIALHENRHEEALGKLKAVADQNASFSVISILGDLRIELALAHQQGADNKSAWEFFERALLEVCDTGIIGPLLLCPVAALRRLRPLIPG